jgi:hypothetical protein
MVVRFSARFLLPALAVCFLLPTSGHAQMFQPTRTTQIQIEYREPMPANGDLSALRMKIYAEVQKDCDAAAQAFQSHCSVANISFNDIANNNGQPPTGVIARAQLMLTNDQKPNPPN